MTQAIGAIEAEIEAVIQAPATSRWLQIALTAALSRDCVDAAKDADLLAELLGRRCDAFLGGA